MISKNPYRKTDSDSILSHELLSEIFADAVAAARRQAKELAVPISTEIDGNRVFELPDGTFVDEDPWQGKAIAPEGWYQRWGVDPPPPHLRARREP